MLSHYTLLAVDDSSVFRYVYLLQFSILGFSHGRYLTSRSTYRVGHPGTALLLRHSSERAGCVEVLKTATPQVQL